MSRGPNILLLFTDQQRFDTIGALGNPYIQTPELDRLTAEGVAFTSAYTPSPVCVSARCSLVTGRYAHNTGCTDNMAMPPGQVSLMEILQENGYQTHGTGKMHFTPDSHRLWGFDSRDYSEEGGMRTDDEYCRFLCDAGYDHIVDPLGVRSEWYYVPQPSQLPERLHKTRWVADRSLDFLRRRDTGRPFFLWSSFIKPHPPFESPVPWNRLYKSVDVPPPARPEGCSDVLTYWNRYQNCYKWRDQGEDLNLLRLIRAAYYACISYVDYNIGRILAYLRESGELDNTLVVFTSDHGECLGDYGCFGKRSVWDIAARIPLVVRFPDRFSAGERCDRVSGLTDILPTCLAAAGIAPPAYADGTDLAGLATGKNRRDYVLCHLSGEERGLYGLITDDYKYVYSAADEREWLLRRLPGETDGRCLARTRGYASVTDELRRTLVGRFAADGYTGALDGQGWRRFSRPKLPAGPDGGLLFQDGGDVSEQFPPGYTPRTRF